jgi:hypothetical protein
MAVRQNDDDTLTTISYCEGDIEEVTHSNSDAAVCCIDQFAEFHWRTGNSSGPKDIAQYQEGDLPSNYRGPYNPSRT